MQRAAETKHCRADMPRRVHSRASNSPPGGQMAVGCAMRTTTIAGVVTMIATFVREASLLTLAIDVPSAMRECLLKTADRSVPKGADGLPETGSRQVISRRYQVRRECGCSGCVWHG